MQNKLHNDALLRIKIQFGYYKVYVELQANIVCKDASAAAYIHPSHIAYVLCLYNIIMNKQDELDVLFCISLTQQLSVFYQEALSEYANYHHEFIMAHS